MTIEKALQILNPDATAEDFDLDDLSGVEVVDKVVGDIREAYKIVKEFIFSKKGSDELGEN